MSRETLERDMEVRDDVGKHERPSPRHRVRPCADFPIHDVASHERTHGAYPLGRMPEAEYACHRLVAGDKAVARILGLWHATKWIRAVRSLVRGDVVYWEVRAGADSVAGRGTLVLADVVTDLHVAF